MSKRPDLALRNKKDAKYRVGTKEHNIWHGMLARCSNENNKDFHRYGARGISVCDRWKIFENFLTDMGLSPGKMQIDRINNDGNYEPTNCRWATVRENSNNRRSSRRVEFDGENLTIAEWSRKLKMCPKVIRHRLEAKWSLNNVFNLPIHHGNGYKVGTR